MEQVKQDRNYEFTKEELRLLTECHDNRGKKVVNIDHASKLISIINTETKEIRIIGGINVPTMCKAFRALEVDVTNEVLNNKRIK